MKKGKINLFDIILLTGLFFADKLFKTNSIAGWKVSKFQSLYINGKINKNLKLKPSGNQSGVYIIKRGNDIKYIGYSANNVYKTLTRHFQDWSSSRQQRVTYNPGDKLKVRIIYTNTALQAATLERALIIKYKPDDNPNKYEQYLLTDKENKTIVQYLDDSEAPF